MTNDENEPTTRYRCDMSLDRGVQPCQEFTSRQRVIDWRRANGYPTDDLDRRLDHHLRAAERQP